MAKNKWFGTDGVRGVANVFPMTIDFAMKLGMVSGMLLCQDQKKVAIAKDTRVSADMLEAALVAGFTSQGVDVVLLGVMPTPALTTLVEALKVDMAVMITASHNPYQDNGIKLINAIGDKFSDDITAKIEEAMEKDNFAFDPQKIGKVYSENLIADYEKIAQSVVQGGDGLTGMKVVLDCANGCFSGVLPKVFRACGAEVIALSEEPNGVNINLDCGSQHTQNMCAKVLETGADMGIAVDGDGDRIIICDEKGQRLDGDQIIAFLGLYFKQKNKLKANTVVATIVSNPAMDRFFAEKGISCVRSAVGERYVIEEMKKIGANIGGEESGHMVVADYAKTGDAMMTGLIVAQGVWEAKQKMSQIFPLFKPMIRKRIDTKFVSKDEMISAFDSADFKQAIADGEQMISGYGKVLIRKSGTEPKIQVWVWSDDEDKALQTAQKISSMLEKMNGFELFKNVN